MQTQYLLVSESVVALSSAIDFHTLHAKIRQPGLENKIWVFGEDCLT